MIRQPVRSSNLRSVAYDMESQVLEIEFANGSVYEYAGVPSAVHAALMPAASHGSFFNRNIKDRYPHRELR